jgi:hypothetical protein
VRTLHLWDAGFDSPLESFRSDQAMMAVVGCGRDQAACRLWQRPARSLCAGRFHRIPAVVAGMDRRQSGGRVVPTGPGVLACTLVLPGVAWLEPAAGHLRPEQVLNRALRPLLALLRALAVDVFSAGRDLVTFQRRVLLYAAFAVAADGVIVVDQFVSLDEPFSIVTELLAQCDPAGVAGVEAEAFAGAVTLSDLVALPARESWLALLGEHLAAEFGCEVCIADALTAAVVHQADESAHAAFRAERADPPLDAVSAAAPTMLGMIEANAVLVDGRVHDLVVCGDLIAPFGTLELVAAECEGQRLHAAALERAVTTALADPASFILGVRDLGALIARMG